MRGAGNRFARRIRSGEIESVEELKAAFRALARESHPDLQGPEADGTAFIAVRDEYETALANFERHRFGASRHAQKRDAAPAARAGGGDAGCAAGCGSAAAAAVRGDGLSSEAWACLALIRKRGFPKSPRHEKERMRYEYARWRLLRALGPVERGLFPSFEAELHALRRADREAFTLVEAILSELVEYALCDVDAMRVSLVIGLGGLRADPRIGPGILGILVSLASGLGVGAALAED